MPESVPVRCPACRREHTYTAQAYPCVCGAQVAPALDRRSAPAVVVHRIWDEDWITVRCGSCRRPAQWPRPELGCPCGTLLRIPVADTEGDADGSAVRPAPEPLVIRTARDAVAAAVVYLQRLGHEGIRRADRRPLSGVGLAARGLLAHVDAAARRASARDVECLWLTAMAESVNCVYFSLAGYADDARARADALGIPLFVLGLSGVTRPVNGPADKVHATRR
ncbi:hypothetical protein [Streptomyces cyanogenus]|uniref:Uncharacterized protein n=1 Tax=Streptomyces cyanogenus TaxID=80860 RepID=A0ABX7TYE2_STRCY|nr:hypothetical protein [Streptomyces cyanogenus]QTE01796.1 hypothetical protein S1361_30985 [Streptomyces cyanogenus]